MPDILVHIDDYSIKQIKNDIAIKRIVDGSDTVYGEAEKAGGLIAMAAERGRTEITIALAKPKAEKKGRGNK